MSLQFLFKPEAVALIGASNNPTKVGREILDNLIAGGWSGKIYPINLKEKKILGRPAFNSLTALSGVNFKALLVVIAIPAPFVLAEVKQAGELGVKNIIIISSGFKEVGTQGKKLETDLQSLAKEYQLNILGPNCLGLINTAAHLNATFSRATRQSGRVALISQSGAIGSALLDWLQQKNLNLRYFVSLGNKAVLDETDLLDYLRQDVDVDLFIFYLEEIKNGRRFMNLISRISKKHPVVILKAGRSAAAQKLALSHTGSLAGPTEVIKAGLRRAGAVWLENLEELFNFLLLFKKINQPTAEKPILHLITNAGGPAVLTVDEISRQGLLLGESWDLLGDADAARYQVALNKLLARPAVHNLLVLLTPQVMTEPLKVAQLIIAAARRYPRKLIFCSFLGGTDIQTAKELLLKNNLPFFDYPEEAVKTLARLYDYWQATQNLSEYSDKLMDSSGVEKSTARRLATLKLLGASAAEIKNYQIQSVNRPQFLGDYLKSLAWLKRAGLSVVRTEKYSTTKSFSRYPLVLKIVGPDFIHKTESGGVITGLATPANLQLAAKNLATKQGRALKDSRNYLVVQEQVQGALEMIIGFKQDPSFGPVILIGLGGIYAEVFQEVRLEIADLDLTRARAVLKSLRFYPLLSGARGRRPYALEALANTLVKLSQLANDFPEIKELDINPLFVLEKKVVGGDVRIII